MQSYNVTIAQRNNSYMGSWKHRKVAIQFMDHLQFIKWAKDLSNLCVYKNKRSMYCKPTMQITAERIDGKEIWNY